jgi:hypothetical protein
LPLNLSEMSTIYDQCAPIRNSYFGGAIAILSFPNPQGHHNAVLGSMGSVDGGLPTFPKTPRGGNRGLVRRQKSQVWLRAGADTHTPCVPIIRLELRDLALAVSLVCLAARS